MSWKAGKKIEVSARWHTSSLAGILELTTGSPYFRVSRIDQLTGVREYDQGGGTFGAPATTFPLAYLAGEGWRAAYDMPLAANGYEITIEAIHPAHPEVLKDIGWVSPDGNDILDALASGGLAAGDVEQDKFQPV